MLNCEGTENRTLRHTKSAIVVSSHTFITYAFLPLTPRTTFLPHVSMRKNTRRHAITYSCFVLKHGHAVFLTRWALGAECVKEGLLGRDFDEKWHGLMECDFKLPHLQERRNRPPNFTMMMSAGLHDSVRLKCQVSFLPPPCFFSPPSSFSALFFTSSYSLALVSSPLVPSPVHSEGYFGHTLAYRSCALTVTFTRDDISRAFGQTGKIETVICWCRKELLT